MNQHQRRLEAKCAAFLEQYRTATPEERRRFHEAFARMGVSFEEATKALNAFKDAWAKLDAGRPASPRGSTGRTRA